MKQLRGRVLTHVSPSTRRYPTRARTSATSRHTLRVRLALVLVVTACGRVGFPAHLDPNRDAASTVDASMDVAMLAPDTVIDAPLPVAYANFDMEGDPSAGLTATDPAYIGTCTACPTVTSGHHGNGIYFDSSKLVTMSFQVGVQPYTIASWFSTNGQGTLLAKPLDQTSVYNVVNIAINGSGEVVYETYGVGPDYLTSVGVSIFGGWHHVAITWDGTTKVLYLGGVDVGSAPATLSDANELLVLGTDIDGGVPSVQYTGALDELRFYDVVLAAPQIAALAAL